MMRTAVGEVIVMLLYTALFGTPESVGVAVMVCPFCRQKSPETVVMGQ